MPIPDYQTLMRPVLQALAQHVKTRSELVEILSTEFQLTQEERDREIASGRSTVMYGRVGWALTYLKQAGLISFPKRGFNQLTETGITALTSGQAIDNRYLQNYPAFQQFYKRSRSSTSEQNSTNSTAINADINLPPQERLESAYQELHASLADDLLEQVKEQNPRFFELLVVQLMQAMGYGGWSEKAGQATQYSNDGGIDGIINEDPLGLDTIYLQAKRYTENPVGRPDVQAFVGALEMKRAKKGVFITTSRFSREAIEYVNLIEKRVVLIDGPRLAELMIHYNLGVSVRETYSIKHIDSDYFSEVS